MTFSTALDTFISLSVYRGGRNANVVENNRVWPSAPAQQRSHFPNPVGVFHQEKERQRKGGKNHWVLFKKLSGCLDPARLKERQRDALSLSDKWTSSIDCKVYWWGGK